MSERGEFGRALLVACDISSFGSGDDLLQLDKQRGLATVLDEAAAAARLVRSSWHRNDRGDGELALLPDSEPEPRVIDDFIHQLTAALSRFNRHRVTQAQLRLRVAIHFGVAYPADNGYAGNGLVTVSRLLDSEPIRFALRDSNASLALILSDGVYQETVVNGHTSVTPDAFRKVGIRLKEYNADAWLWLPCRAVHDLQFTDDQDRASTRTAPAGGQSAAARPRAAAPDPTVVQEFHGAVYATDHPVFGVSIDNRHFSAD